MSPSKRGIGAAVARRASWGFFDQALSSGSNFALSAFVAAAASARAFGAFTIVYAVYNVVLGLTEGLASMPLVVRHSSAAPDRYRTAARASVGTALAVGTIAGLICLAVSPLTPSPIAGPVRALGFTLPGLVTQDAWRFSFVTGGHPAKAAVNDAIWVTVMLAGVGVLLPLGAVTPTSMILLWGGSASAAAVMGCWQERVVPAPRQATAWLRSHRELTLRYAAEAVVHRSGAWLVLTVVGSVAGLKVLGALRGALLFIGGPLNLVFVGGVFAFMSESVRLVDHSPARLPVAMRTFSLTATAVAISWCVVVLLLPDTIGSHVLGATWPSAKPLLPLLVGFMVLLAASIGAVQGMLALGAARRSLFTQMAGLAVDLPCISLAAVLAGARGAAVALSVTAVFRFTVAWIQFRRAVREPVASLGLVLPEQSVP